VELLRECAAVFAIPIERDAGTLVEMGMAIDMGKPVVTFDPREENKNTMVVIGSASYSSDLDICLNGLFLALSRLVGAGN
jgi:nucleoside 2-deoxyribosyltransferase